MYYLLNARFVTCQQYTGCCTLCRWWCSFRVCKHRVIHCSHTAPKLSSPDGYRLGITPSQHCIKPAQKNRVVLALQILPTVITLTRRQHRFRGHKTGSNTLTKNSSSSKIITTQAYFCQGSRYRDQENVLNSDERYTSPTTHT